MVGGMWEICVSHDQLSNKHITWPALSQSHPIITLVLVKFSSFGQILGVRTISTVTDTKWHHVWYFGVFHQTLPNVFWSRHHFKSITHSAIWKWYNRRWERYIGKSREHPVAILTNFQNFLLVSDTEKYSIPLKA